LAKRKRHIIAIDLDGTLIENEWPRMGAWKPGAIEAVRRFQREGYAVVVFTMRVSPYWLDGTRRSEADRQKDIDAVRELLDSAGLHAVPIWLKEGKPPYSVLIDDKAERFNPSNRAWRRLTEKVLLRLGAADPLHEDGEWGYEGAPA
jgi:hypothetical protein